MSLQPGSNFGAYRVIEALGRGGMAAVYKVYEAQLDRYVALKVLPAEFLHDPAFTQRFDREAKVIARLEHPNIIPVHACGITDGIPWMAMRLIADGTFSSLLRKGRLPTAHVVSILRGVADALDYAHGQNVIHRDVKPQNVLLDQAGRVYLADFGIARIVEGSTFLTQTGMISGTPQYMAPEQAQGGTVGRGCDIYALGIMAYEAFTGRLPFVADTPVAVLMKHVLEPIPLPPPSEVPEALMRPLLKSLAKKPEDRWTSATSFVAALEQAAVAGAAPQQITQTVTSAHALPGRSPVLGPRMTIGMTLQPAPAADGRARWGAPRALRWAIAAIVVAGLGVLALVERRAAVSPPPNTPPSSGKSQSPEISLSASSSEAARPLPRDRSSATPTPIVQSATASKAGSSSSTPAPVATKLAGAERTEGGAEAVIPSSPAAAVDRVPSLIEQLEDPRTFGYAAQELARRKDPRAVDALVRMLKSPRNARSAAEALGELGDPRAIGPLIEALNNEDADYGCLIALGRLKASAAVEPLLRMLESRGLNDSVKSRLIETLGEIGDVKAMEPLLALMERSPIVWRQTILSALGGMPDARAAATLAAALKDPDGRLQNSAEYAFVRVQARYGCDPLLQLLEDPEPRVRRNAVLALEKMSRKALGADKERWQKWCGEQR